MAASQRCRDIFAAKFADGEQSSATEDGRDVAHTERGPRACEARPPSTHMKMHTISPEQRLRSCNHVSEPQFFRCVKDILPILVLAVSIALAGCGWLGAQEAYKHESGRTVYRAAEESPMDVPEGAPVRQKVPGE
jgi:hypothetical protein